MMRKQKPRNTSQIFNHAPWLAIVVLVIFQLFWGHFFQDIALNLLQRLTLFIAPLLIGWLMGWGLRIRFAPKQMTSRGISVHFAQFLLALLPLLIFIGFFALLLASVDIVNIAVADDGGGGGQINFAGIMTIVVAVLMTVCMTLYSRLTMWLGQWFGVMRRW